MAMVSQENRSCKIIFKSSFTYNMLKQKKSKLGAGANKVIVLAIAKISYLVAWCVPF